MRPFTELPSAVSSCFAGLVLALALVPACRQASAETLPFEGRLVLSLPGLEEMEVAAGVGVAEVNGLQLETFEILSATITGSTGIPITDPTAAPVTSLRVLASIPSGLLGIDPFGGPFSEPAITSNALAMPGSVRICMLVAPLPPCLAGLGVPLTNAAAGKGAGIGGLLTVGVAGTLRMSLQGAPFTLHTAYVTAETEYGAIFTVFSTGSIGGPYLFTSTAGQPGGFLSVVTPIRVVIGQSGEPVNVLPGFLRFEVQFLPEPGVLLLLVSGAGGLSFLGRMRRRESRQRSQTK